MTCPVDGFYEDLEKRIRKLDKQRAAASGSGRPIERGCDSTCNDDHDQNAKCTQCSVAFNRHLGHSCPGRFGQRGSFCDLTDHSESDSDSDESGDVDGDELAASRLQKIADVTKLPVSALKNQSAHELKKIWKKVKDSLEAMRVRCVAAWPCVA